PYWSMTTSYQENREVNWMNPQIKDHFYDQFLKEPTKDNFRDFMKKSCGELNEMDFKETWIDKGPLAKIMLAMANNGGGIIIFGVKENEDNTFDVLGLDNLKDTADISNSISRLVSSSLDYEVFNFVFDSDVYGEFENKKFQIMVIHDTPERLPFVSLGQSEKIEKDVIYVRRGTKSEKATSEEINRIIERKIATIYSENTDMSLDQHLEQLKKLYSELPQKIRVLVRKGSQPNFAAALKVFGERIGALYGTPDEYEEKDNPNYPDEGYEAFILRMIDAKKLKIEKVLDLK
uniref:AlbA family DNA-binding domain-containing protein n=2 Tax=Lachnospirales TaxID=3085636 RepID=UPI0022E1EFA6